jgi:predicted AAA+ superfamily ATPase
LTQHQFPLVLRVDLLEPETLRSLSAHPERLRELIAARLDVRHVLIDEVQKLPELLEVAHLLIEEKRGIQFIFTGSSARKHPLAALSRPGAVAA